MSEITDIFLKIADGKEVSPTERERLRQFVIDVEDSKNYTQSLKSGQGNIRADSVVTKSMTVGNDVFLGYSAKVVRSTSQSIPTGVTTYIQWQSVEYSNLPSNMIDLTTSPTKIYIPVSGRYQVGGNFGMNTYSYWRLDLCINGTLFASDFVPITSNFTEDVYIESGSYVEARAGQWSGGSLNLVGNLYIKLTGTK